MGLMAFEVELWIEPSVLDKHDGKKVPPPNDVDDWNFSDVVQAIELGIVDPYESTIERI